MIVDSGTSFLMLPSADVDLLIDYLNYEQGMGCIDASWAITCPCVDDNYIEWFPDFTLNIGNTTSKPYFIPKEQYVYEKDGVCALLLMRGSKTPFWILGLSNFFPNYYVVFDMENYRIGFAINKNAKKRVSEMYEQFQKEQSLIQQGLKIEPENVVFVGPIAIVSLLFVSAAVLINKNKLKKGGEAL